MNNVVLKLTESFHEKSDMFDFDDSLDFWRSFFPELKNEEDFYQTLSIINLQYSNVQGLQKSFNSYKRPYYSLKHIETIDDTYYKSIMMALEDIDSDLLGWKYFYFPILLTSLYDIYNEIKESAVILDTNVIFLDLVKSITLTLFQMSYRVLIAETNNTGEEKKLKGNNSKERSQYFKSNLLRNSEYLTYIFNKYYVLTEQMLIKIKMTSSFAIEIISRYKADEAKITSSLNKGKSYGRICSIHYGAGDTHKGGKTVAIVTCENGTVVYKPRSLDIENKFNNFINWLNKQENSGLLKLKYASVVDFGNYGWSEFITPQHCFDDNEVKNYYKRIGQLLAIFYMFGSTDLHSENIIAKGEYPFIIDLETLFSVDTIKYDDNESVMNYIGRRIAESVQASAILPIQIRNRKLKKQADISGLSAVENQLSPFKSNFVINHDTDKISVKSDFGYLKSHDNQVVMQNCVKSSSDFINEILCGFKSMYLYVLDNKNFMKEVINTLFDKVQFRVILRSTVTYSQLLSTGFHPDIMQFRMDLCLYYHRLAINVTNDFSSIVKSEYFDLLNYDIPAFTCVTDELALIDSKGNSHKGLFQKTAIEKCLDRIDSFSEEDFNLQKRIINYSYADMYESDYTKTNCKFHQDIETLIDRNEAIRFVESIAELCVKNSIILIKDGLVERSWVGYIEVDSIFRQISPVGFNVYDGNAGIALFFAALAKITGKQKYIQYVEEILRPIVNYLKKFDLKNEQQNGLYNGYFGVLYIFHVIANLINHNDYRIIVGKILKGLSNENICSRYSDIIIGNSGAISTLFELESSGIDYGIEYIPFYQKLLEQLINDLVKGENETYHIGNEGYTGFAHGTAGISHLFNIYVNRFKNEKLKEYTKGLLKHERLLYNSEKSNWARSLVDDRCDYKWCHGATGILLNRLYLLTNGWMDDCILEEIDSCIQTMTQDSFGYNPCLCHGDFGNLLVLYEASKVLNKDKLCKQVESTVQELINIMKKKISEDEEYMNKTSMGLMTGLAGIGYATLYFIREGLCLPNILTLSLGESDNV